MSIDVKKREETEIKELVDALASIKEETREVHVCKICGQRLFADMCQFHKEKTGHNEFRLVSNNNQETIKNDRQTG